MPKTKFVSILALAAVVWLGCSPKATPTADMAGEQAQVKDAIDGFQHFWENEDTTFMTRHVAHDPDMVCFGTDAGEHFVGWQALHDSTVAMLAAFDSTKVAVHDQVIKIDPDGHVAWFSQFLDFDTNAGGQHVHLPGVRMTGVLEKRGTDWVFVQFHTSVPVQGQAAQY